MSERVGYAELLQVAARRRLVVSGAVSRLPLAGAGVAIVLAVGDGTGSYGLGGTASALYVIGASVLAPVHGRRMDQYGQRRVLVTAAAVQVMALIGLMLACVARSGWMVPQVVVASLVAGAAQVDIGSAVRARWAYAVSDPSARQTAFFLESVVDEMMFVITPLAIILTTALYRWAAPAVVLLGPAVGWLLLAAQVSTTPPPTGLRSAGYARGGFLGRRKSIIGAFVGIGAYLGSIEILLVALADRQGSPIWAGVALAAWAIGSASAALLAGPRLGQMPPGRIFLPAVGWMTGCGLMLPFADSGLLMAAACFLAGIGAAPSLSAGFSLVRDSAPLGSAEGMAWASAGMGAGTTVGAFTGGWLVDQVQSTSAFWLSVLFGAGVLFLAWRTRRGAES